MDAASLAWRLWVPRVLGSLVLLALLWLSPLWFPCSAWNTTCSPA